MSDEEKPVETKEEKESNVYSLTGDPYEPPEVSVAQPCADTVNCLKDVLDHATANQIRGVYILGWSPAHQRFVRWCMMPSGENIEGAALRFIGGLEVAKADMVAVMTGNIIEIDEDGNPTG